MIRFVVLSCFMEIRIHQFFNKADSCKSCSRRGNAKLALDVPDAVGGSTIAGIGSF